LQFSAALADAVRAGGRTKVAAAIVAELLEAHMEREDHEVLQILGLLEPLAADRIDAASVGDYPELQNIETNTASLHEEHAALAMAAEKLLATARTEGVDAVVECAERLLSRIELDEQIFYPAALLIRNYLRLKGRRHTSPQVSSLEVRR
jgi:hypothetical protein